MIEHFPTVIIEDRYRGAYSGGRWLAIRNADHAVEMLGASRIVHCLTAGPHGDDTDAMMFWDDPPAWIAVGATPDEALARLRADASLPPARKATRPRDRP